MKTAYRPAGLDSLADLDRAGVPYEETPVLLEGVIAEGSGSGSSRETCDVQMLTIAAYRVPGEPLQEAMLLVLLPVESGHLFRDEFPPYSFWRLNVVRTIPAVRATRGDRAILLSWEPCESDDELDAFASSMRAPKVFRSPLLGDLTLDRSIDRFEGSAEWNGEPIQVSVDPDETGSPETALKTADVLWSDQPGWKRRIEEFAVSQLLELFNDTWRDEEDSEHTAEQFVARMDLASVSLTPDGEFEFWYDDGDLFARHSIYVRGNLEEGPLDASIAG